MGGSDGWSGVREGGGGSEGRGEGVREGGPGGSDGWSGVRGRESWVE